MSPPAMQQSLELHAQSHEAAAPTPAAQRSLQRTSISRSGSKRGRSNGSSRGAALLTSNHVLAGPARIAPTSPVGVSSRSGHGVAQPQSPQQQRKGWDSSVQVDQLQAKKDAIYLSLRYRPSDADGNGSSSGKTKAGRSGAHPDRSTLRSAGARGHLGLGASEMHSHQHQQTRPSTVASSSSQFASLDGSASGSAAAFGNGSAFGSAYGSGLDAVLAKYGLHKAGPSGAAESYSMLPSTLPPSMNASVYSAYPHWSAGGGGSSAGSTGMQTLPYQPFASSSLPASAASYPLSLPQSLARYISPVQLSPSQSPTRTTTTTPLPPRERTGTGTGTGTESGSSPGTQPPSPSKAPSPQEIAERMQQRIQDAFKHISEDVFTAHNLTTQAQSQPQTQTQTRASSPTSLATMPLPALPSTASSIIAASLQQHQQNNSPSKVISASASVVLSPYQQHSPSGTGRSSPAQLQAQLQAHFEKGLRTPASRQSPSGVAPAIDFAAPSASASSYLASLAAATPQKTEPAASTAPEPEATPSNDTTTPLRRNSSPALNAAVEFLSAQRTHFEATFGSPSRSVSPTLALDAAEHGSKSSTSTSTGSGSVAADAASNAVMDSAMGAFYASPSNTGAVVEERVPESSADSVASDVAAAPADDAAAAEPAPAPAPEPAPEPAAELEPAPALEVSQAVAEIAEAPAVEAEAALVLEAGTEVADPAAAEPAAAEAAVAPAAAEAAVAPAAAETAAQPATVIPSEPETDAHAP
jgi:hypothetical protein